MDSDFQLGAWRVQPQLNRVACEQRSVRLEPKMMGVLVCLAKRSGKVVPKEQLVHEVWPDTFVTDDVLIRCISELRKTFRDSAGQPAVIETIPKKGYRLLIPVTRVCIATLGAIVRGKNSLIRLQFCPLKTPATVLTLTT
jgi:DNA-binding winged helix-turn-helix (wHTH) protein